MESEVVINNGLTTEKFLAEIEKLVLNFNMDYLDAVVYY